MRAADEKNKTEDHKDVGESLLLQSSMLEGK